MDIIDNGTFQSLVSFGIGFIIALPPLIGYMLWKCRRAFWD